MIPRTEQSMNVRAFGIEGGATPPTPSPAGDGGAVTLLPAPEATSGDPIAMIAKLLIKSSQQRRESEDLTATMEEKAEDAADAQRLASMKDKAEKNFVAGMIGGFSQVGAGACSLTGGLRSARTLNQPGPPVVDGKLSAPDFRADMAKSTGSIWDGASQISSGAGKVGETLFKNLADRADLDVVKAESEGKVHRRAADALHKQVDAASAAEGKVIQLLQEIKQAQQQCERAALLKMA